VPFFEGRRPSGAVKKPEQGDARKEPISFEAYSKKDYPSLVGKREGRTDPGCPHRFGVYGGTAGIRRNGSGIYLPPGLARVMLGI
jgi:hypothetical protein